MRNQTPPRDDAAETFPGPHGYRLRAARDRIGTSRCCSNSAPHRRRTERKWTGLLMEEIGRMRAGLEMARACPGSGPADHRGAYCAALFSGCVPLAAPGPDRSPNASGAARARNCAPSASGKTTRPDFQPGDELLLSHERNFIFSKTAVDCIHLRRHGDFRPLCRRKAAGDQVAR